MTVSIFEYVGARPNGIQAPDLTQFPLPPPPGDVFFMLAFANDAGGGNFQPNWDPAITPDLISQLTQNGGVNFRASLGGDYRYGPWVPPSDQAGWVTNAASSLGQLMDTYHLEGIDIDYEGLPDGSPLDDSFVQCMSQVIVNLGSARNGTVASLIPFGQTIGQYQALYNQCGTWVSNVNYQAYADGIQDVQGYLDLYARLAQQNPFGYTRLGLGIASSQSQPLGLQPPDIYTVWDNLHTQGLETVAIWAAEYSVQWNPSYTIENTIVSHS